MNFDIAVQELNSNFSSSQDQQYLKNQLSHINRLSLFSKKPHIKKIGENRFELAFLTDKKIKVQLIDTNHVQIDGVDFRIDLAKPLAETHSKLTQILESITISEVKNPFEFILPKAHAILPLVGAAALVVVLPPVINTARERFLEYSLTSTLNSCLHRDKSIAYEKSLFFKKINSLDENKIYSLAVQDKMNCESWAKNVSLRDEHQKYEKLLGYCTTGNEILKCANDYKKETKAINAKNKSPSADKASDSEGAVH
jgi:hypothetical protein